MSLSEFRVAFVKYANEIELSLPDVLTNASEVALLAGINQHLTPFKHDMNLCYSNLESLIVAAGLEVPELSDEQKAKVKRFLKAFIKCVE